MPGCSLLIAAWGNIVVALNGSVVTCGGGGAQVYYVTSGPVPRAIKVEEEAPGCEDSKGKHSSADDLFAVWQQMMPPHRKKYQCRHKALSNLTYLLSDLVDTRGHILIPNIIDDMPGITDKDQRRYNTIDFDLVRLVPRAIKVEEEALGCEDTEGKRFTDNDSFLAWQQIAHQHREKKHQCRFCPFSSSRTSGVKEHERTHTGEKPFSCRVCQRVFTLKGNLQVHERIHTGEKPFRCQTCEKAFSHRSGLQAHLRVHTGERPFMCQTCQKAFANSSDLKRHRRVHMGDKPY
ncbi:hypothetical protein HPB47_026971, partial [Ixodes persulcatus]